MLDIFTYKPLIPKELVNTIFLSMYSFRYLVNVAEFWMNYINGLHSWCRWKIRKL